MLAIVLVGILALTSAAVILDDDPVELSPTEKESFGDRKSLYFIEQRPVPRRNPGPERNQAPKRDLTPNKQDQNSPKRDPTSPPNPTPKQDAQIDPGGRDNPGARIRLSKAAVEQLVRASSALIFKNHMARTMATIDRRAGDLRIFGLNFAPDGDLAISAQHAPPHKLRTFARQAKFTLTFKFEIVVGKQPLTGSATARSSGFDFDTSLIFYKSIQSALQMEFLPSESRPVSAKQISLSFPAGIQLPPADLARLQGTIAGTVMVTFSQLLAAALTRHFKKTTELSTVYLPIFIRLPADTKDSDPQDSALFHDLYKHASGISSNLTVNNALATVPTLSADYLDLSLKAEVSWKGKGGTPFFPRSIPPLRVTDRMVEVQISDYVLNACVYAIHNAGYPVFELNEKIVPSMAQQLRTTCKEEDVDCFGNLFPNAAKKYPNHRVELRMDSARPPYFKIQQGKITRKINGRFTILGRPLSAPPQQNAVWVIADVTSETSSETRIDSSKIVGNMKDVSVKLGVVQTALSSKSDKMITEEGHFLLAYIHSRVDQMLKNGLVVVDIRGLHFSQPRLTFSENYFTVEANFLANEGLFQGGKPVDEEDKQRANLNRRAS